MNLEFMTIKLPPYGNGLPKEFLIPKGSQVMSLQCRGYGLYLTVLKPSCSYPENETRTFEVFTDERIIKEREMKNLKYIGSGMGEDYEALHVFEVLGNDSN